MNKKTIKEFWDKNKTVIITGVTSCIIGGVIGGAVAKRPRGEAQEFIKQFSEFDIGTNGMSFFADMLKAQEGSTMSFVHNSDVRGLKVADAMKHAVEWYSDSNNINPDSVVTGMAVFVDKK